MKMWMIASLLGGWLLSGTWADAQPSGSAATPPEAGTVVVDDEGGPVTATISGSGTMTMTGGGMAIAPGVPASPAAGSSTGGGLIVAPGTLPRAVVAAGSIGLSASGPGIPADGQQRVISIRRGPGGQQVLSVVAQAPVQRYGPMWIASANATLAGKTEKTAFLGVVTTRVSGALRSQLKLKAGLVVESVEPKSSAEAAGLQVHDIIEKCDDQWLINPAQFIGLVRIYKPGDKVTLTVLRQGERKKLPARLEERETYAVDDDGNFFYAQQGPVHFDPKNPLGPVSAFGGSAGGVGLFQPVQQITAGALGAGPLASGFVATFGDDKQQLLITIRDGHQILTAKDPSGKQIFQGPIDTPEQRKLVPPVVRKKLEEMEKIKVKIRTPNFAEPGSETAPAR